MKDDLGFFHHFPLTCGKRIRMSENAFPNTKLVIYLLIVQFNNIWFHLTLDIVLIDSQYKFRREIYKICESQIRIRSIYKSRQLFFRFFFFFFIISEKWFLRDLILYTLNKPHYTASCLCITCTTYPQNNERRKEKKKKKTEKNEEISNSFDRVYAKKCVKDCCDLFCSSIADCSTH